MKRVLSIICVSLLVLSACNSNKKKQADTNINKQEVETKVREFVYPLPSSYEIIDMLNKLEAGYIIGLGNNPSKASEYSTERGMAVNLGIYGGDLSYSSTYNQKQDTYDYVDASRKLIEGLNLTGAIEKDFAKKVEESVDNKEELVQLITNSFYDTHNYLMKNNRETVASMVITGAWVEGVYIATHISEETLNSVEMVNILLKQKDPLVKLLTRLRSNEQTKDIKATIASLEPMEKIYSKIEKDAITKAQIHQIKDEVMKLRSNMVSLN